MYKTIKLIKKKAYGYSMYSAQARNFSNVLYVRYIYLTKAKPIRGKAINSSERMLHKDYNHKNSVEKKSLVVSLKELDVKTNWRAVNR
jgi:hypothetical protein